MNLLEQRIGRNFVSPITKRKAPTRRMPIRIKSNDTLNGGTIHIYIHGGVPLLAVILKLFTQTPS